MLTKKEEEEIRELVISLQKLKKNMRSMKKNMDNLEENMSSRMDNLEEKINRIKKSRNIFVLPVKKTYVFLENGNLVEATNSAYKDTN